MSTVTASQSKIHPPAHNDWVVSRPRLNKRLFALRRDYRIVWVLGSAGSGKTTAVVDAVTAFDSETAWLTLDSTETAPGRLLVHIEDSLRQISPLLTRAATTALAAEVPHSEAAADLADALSRTRLTLVLDEIEHVADAPAALDTLSTFLRCLPVTVKVILISRRTVNLRLGSAVGVGGIGVVTEQELAFNADEATVVLSSLGHADTVAKDAVEATGGWVAGVLFEAWRSPDHTFGGGGETDALNTYLATEIMGDLGDAERWFLAGTSILHSVTSDDAKSLGHTNAVQIMSSLSRRHIPVWFSSDRREMRAHPRFREFLRSELDAYDSSVVGELHRAHGRLLCEQGNHEDAVWSFLSADDTATAAAAGEKAIQSVLRRGDFAIADQWLHQFDTGIVHASEVLTRAQLTAALDRESWAEGASIADRLLAMQARATAGLRLDPALAGMIGTCFIHVGRLEDVVTITDHARSGDATETWKFALGVDMDDQPNHYRDRPDDRGDVVDGLLHRIDLMHGRFDRVLTHMPAPWAASRSSRIAALRATGRLEEAKQLLDEAPFHRSSPALARIRVELAVDSGDTRELSELLEHSRTIALRSSPFCVMLHELQEAMVALRVTHDIDGAQRALDRVESDPSARRRVRIIEQLDMWHGLLALFRSDLDTAHAHLRSAIATMQRWDRQFFLPTAFVYLSEARWRLGQEDLADQAADCALAAATTQGSDHLLLQALHEFPSVLSRRLDSLPDTDTAWHTLGRSVFTDRVTAQSTAVRNQMALPSRSSALTVRLTEFGQCSVVSGEVHVAPKLTKSIELLALLVAQGGTAKKSTLMEGLFDGRSDESAKSYLRQTVNRLKEAFPRHSVVDTDRTHIHWIGGHVSSESVEFEQAVRQSMRLQGAARFDAATRALTITDKGEYLDGFDSTFAVNRRRDLREKAVDTRYDAAATAYSLGYLESAANHVRDVLTDDPYRESSWRLSMKVAAAMGQDDRIISDFRRCQDRLAEIQTSPAQSTRRLLDQLRR